VWDRRARVLHWVGDRFGANRHYFHHRPGALHIACEVKALAPWLDAIQVDPAGLASMLTFGYHISDLTILKGAHCLPNARRLMYLAGEDALRLERYWNYPYGEAQPLQGSEDDLAEALHAHLSTALRRQLRGADKILLPISGGLDSRTMAGLLEQSGFDGEVLAYSFGQTTSRDVRYGRAIARKLGYRHVHIPAPVDFLTRHLEDAAWRFDAEWSAKNAWIHFAHQYLPTDSLSGYAALHGLMGDIVLGSDLFGYQAKVGNSPQPIEVLRQVFLQVHVSYMPLAEIDQVFDPAEATCIEARLHGILNHTLEPTVGLRPFYALQRAEFEHRQQRRTTWLVRCVEEDLPALTPFLDRHLVDFATRIPYALFHDRHLYMHMIQRHLPKLAMIPWSDSGLSLSPTRLQAGMAWRLERVIQAVPHLKRYLVQRNEMIDFRDRLRAQIGFFRQRMGILEEISPLAPQSEILKGGLARM
jgi:asparagine synthetase B (glutamine-hydrolysing)